MFFFKKPTKEELAELPLDKGGRKEGRSLVKGVNKFLRYNDDLIADPRKEEIRAGNAAFLAALDEPAKKRRELEVMAQELTDLCKKSVKDYKPSAWKENIEVIFVAVVIAMGIRAYFIQQFKIPTGSMQPTLNGIIAYPPKELNATPEGKRFAPDDYESPGLPQRIWDKIWYGRTHVEWIAEEDDAIITDREHLYEETHFIFFTRTYLKTLKGHVFSAPGTKSRVGDLVATGPFPHRPEERTFKVKAGDTIAKGFIDTGDQLVVNKWIYHFKKPHRGDVFVFDTQNIYGIQIGVDPRHGSQHYIKRIGGEPGDTLEIDPPYLMVNGETATEPGFVRVMSKEGYYTGYTPMGARHANLGKGEYWALGDNSANSSDSRNWGVVPEENIVGRAAFVYYPFGHHFGFVD